MTFFFSLKVNKAIATNSSQKQWVNLGIMSEACITLPDTCGPEGAAVAVWVKIYKCANSNGFLSSLKSGKTGFMFYCFTASIRYKNVHCFGRFFWGGGMWRQTHSHVQLPHMVPTQNGAHIHGGRDRCTAINGKGVQFCQCEITPIFCC